MDGLRETTFRKFVKAVGERSGLQRKAISAFHGEVDDVYWERAEKFADGLLMVLEDEGLSIDYVADAYVGMCKEILREQIMFRRSGKYSCTCAADAKKAVYDVQERMRAYLYGLALSIFLWRNHYRMFDFFIRESGTMAKVSRYLEIGPGHGLYLLEAMERFPRASFHAIDLSPAAIEISRKMTGHFGRGGTCEFSLMDLFDISECEYDYVVMCEVLEHVDDPCSALDKVRELVRQDGRVFVTTCVNCPAVDHVFRFETVDQIRTKLNQCGFGILSELILPVEGCHGDTWEGQGPEINYAAMMKRS